ncbi:MAG TPA: hypothetical protein H9717_08930 [Candidatus Eisenbergiella merdipullorum]|uniref:Anti-sigma factor RsgI-like middle domain-containing protein n=1 Tax=Candidatus Eisenbergiella merdipullorum TaxID=2838553 RepID=A0A9D2I4M2_9FIRM|nr:hypothetical protein [Candidatus Eisenbergiella merdipullorum]
MNDRIRERVKEAFHEIHAEEELKKKTKAFLFQKLQAPSGCRTGRLWHLVPVMACLLLIAVVGGGWRLYFTPTAAISIDVNPSLELEINRFDRVLSVKGYNDDGQSLADSLDIRFMDYDDAVRQILESTAVTDLLSRDAALTIAVTGSDEEQCGRILSDMESCTSGHENAHCYSTDSAETEKAHELGLSLGKYNAFLVLQELDPDITPEEVQNMTMREIRDLIEALSPGGQENEEEHEGHHGRGHGAEEGH